MNTQKDTTMSYSSAKWAEVKSDYEAGLLTIEKLSNKYSISRPAIVKKIMADEWEKGKHKSLIEQTIAEKNIEMFAKLGMTQERVAQTLIDGINLSQTTTKELVETLKESGGDDLIKAITRVVPKLVDDRRVVLNYIQELNKMCGSLAPAKREVTGEGGSPLIPPGLSEEELKKKILTFLPDDNS